MAGIGDGRLRLLFWCSLFFVLLAPACCLAHSPARRGAALTGRAVDPHVALRARGGLREPAAVGGVLAPHRGPGHGAGGIPKRLRPHGAPPGGRAVAVCGQAKKVSRERTNSLQRYIANRYSTILILGGCVERAWVDFRISESETRGRAWAGGLIAVRIDREYFLFLLHPGQNCYYCCCCTCLQRAALAVSSC